MTKLLLIRHGYSKANQLNLFLGHGNVDLTEQGRLQAQKTAQFLIDTHIDAIYSSDLDRAMQTAEYTAKLKNLPIIKDEGLREIKAGDWDFLSFDEIKKRYLKEFNTWCNDVEKVRCPNGESFLELQDRVFKTIEKIAKNNPDKTIAIFSHATSIKSFSTKIENISGLAANDYPYPSNASVTTATYQNGTFNLLQFSRDDFLSDLSTNLPDDV